MARKDKKTGKRMTAAEEAVADVKEAKEEGRTMSGNARRFAREPGDDKMVRVRFVQKYGAYNGGEVAGFTTPRANALIAAGIAATVDKDVERQPTKRQLADRKVEEQRKEVETSRAAAKAATQEAKEISTGE